MTASAGQPSHQSTDQPSGQSNGQLSSHPPSPSIGLDLVDVERFEAALARRAAMSRRLFTDAELDYAHGTASPGTRLAARFAAKEAVMKVLGIGLGACRFRDIEVVRRPGGRPELALSGTAAQRAEAAGLTGWQVTLSHTDGVAGAMVLAQSDRAQRDWAQRDR